MPCRGRAGRPFEGGPPYKSMCPLSGMGKYRHERGKAFDTPLHMMLSFPGKPFRALITTGPPPHPAQLKLESGIIFLLFSFGTKRNQA